MQVQEAKRIFNINCNLNQSQLRSLYARLSQKCHPDLYPNDVGKEARFKELSEAYHTLKLANSFVNDGYRTYADDFFDLRDEICKRKTITTDDMMVLRKISIKDRSLEPIITAFIDEMHEYMRSSIKRDIEFRIDTSKFTELEIIGLESIIDSVLYFGSERNLIEQFVEPFLLAQKKELFDKMNDYDFPKFIRQYVFEAINNASSIMVASSDIQMIINDYVAFIKDVRTILGNDITFKIVIDFINRSVSVTNAERILLNAFTNSFKYSSDSMTPCEQVSKIMMTYPSIFAGDCSGSITDEMVISKPIEAKKNGRQILPNPLFPELFR